METQQMTIRTASKRCNIPYENAKLINRIYVRQGRRNRLRDMSKLAALRCEALEVWDPEHLPQPGDAKYDLS